MRNLNLDKFEKDFRVSNFEMVANGYEYEPMKLNIWECDANFQYHIKEDVSMTMPKKEFQRLIDIVNREDEEKWVRQNNFTVQKAYEQYQMLLALTR
jgi:hypothetical protein